MLRTLVLAILTCTCITIGFAQDPTYYRHEITWQQTVQSSLEALSVMRSKEGPAAPVEFGAWLSIGPFKAATKNAFTEAFPPDSEFLSGKSYRNGTLRWVPRPEWHDGVVTMFEQSDYSAMYLSRSIVANADTTITLSLGSDDGIKVWFDGKLVLQHEIDRGAEPDQEVLNLPVPRGDHRLLLKINNGQGPWGFYFARVDHAARTIARLVQRDFPSSRDRQQMDWEMEDTIWAPSWIPGDYRELARRYASATLFETPPERQSAVAGAASVTSASDVESFRTRYLRSREVELTPVVLTPKPPSEPRINSARVFGVRPGNPFLFTIAATGIRPIRFTAKGLPAGLALDPATGRITGTVTKPGRYGVDLGAVNSAGSAKQLFTINVGSQIALTPPLGWNSWNCFASAVDDAKVRAAADAMVKSGLIDHGWTYINIDDCWEIKPGSTNPMLRGEPRNPDGRINTNAKFPNMKALGAYVHEKGLKLGIYSSPGPLTCAGFTASYQFEQQDASQYADWGVDYLKYDWCSYGNIEKERTLPAFQKPYSVMRAALNRVHRDILFSLCQYGMGNVWEWGGEIGGNCWRTTGDIEDTWASMTAIGFAQAGHEKFAKPGNWNDPDMLVVGKVGWGPELHPTRLTPNEQYTHITLWTLLSAPLLIGCDMTQMDEFTLSLLTNDEVLAVNQDPLGKQAARISVRGELEVWAKDLDDGSKAVGLFNRGIWRSEVSVTWAELGLRGNQTIRDLWSQKNLGSFADGISRSVPRHGAVLLKVTAAR